MDGLGVFFITSMVLSLGGCIGWQLKQLNEQLDIEELELYKTELQRMISEYEELHQKIHNMQDDYEKAEVERYRALRNIFTGVQIFTGICAATLGYMLNNMVNS